MTEREYEPRYATEATRDTETLVARRMSSIWPHLDIRQRDEGSVWDAEIWENGKLHTIVEIKLLSKFGYFTKGTGFDYVPINHRKALSMTREHDKCCWAIYAPNHRHPFWRWHFSELALLDLKRYRDVSGQPFTTTFFRQGQGPRKVITGNTNWFEAF